MIFNPATSRIARAGGCPRYITSNPLSTQPRELRYSTSGRVRWAGAPGAMVQLQHVIGGCALMRVQDAQRPAPILLSQRPLGNARRTCAAAERSCMADAAPPPRPLRAALWPELYKP